MSREALVWTIIIVVAAIGLALNTYTRGAGNAYVEDVPTEMVNVAADGETPKWINVESEAALDHDLAAVPADKRISWTTIERADPREYFENLKDPDNPYRFSLIETIGVWLAAVFTLAIFSFLYKDNPFYKIAESVVVGVSAAFWMVVGFWDMIIPNLFGKLTPDWVQSWAQPGVDGTMELAYIAPLILGVMLLWRLSPVGGWIARWPMAFIIGVFCGIRLVGFLHSDFLAQIRNSIVPLWVEDPTTGNLEFWESLKNGILLLGILCCLVYFFFSVEHKGAVGKTARVGIWFLMITFGAAFGYTVMGRIALLSIRLEFLFDDWLWLIDPVGKRLTGG